MNVSKDFRGGLKASIVNAQSRVFDCGIKEPIAEAVIEEA